MKRLTSLALSLLLAAPLLAEEPQTKTEGCKMDHQAMMQSRKARDAKLNELQTAMNKATGQKKVDLMADILRELLAERAKMHEHMACMMQNGHDMKKMMEHKKQDCGSKPCAKEEPTKVPPKHEGHH